MTRGYSRNQVRDMGFDRKSYRFPKEPGKGTGMLTMKEWAHSQGCLLCFFELDEGEKLILSVWRQKDDARSYKPRNCDLVMTQVPIGSRMDLEYDLTPKGHSRFLYAELVEEVR